MERFQISFTHPSLDQTAICREFENLGPCELKIDVDEGTLHSTEPSLRRFSVILSHPSATESEVLHILKHELKARDYSVSRIAEAPEHAPEPRKRALSRENVGPAILGQLKEHAFLAEMELLQKVLEVGEVSLKEFQTTLKSLKAEGSVVKVRRNSYAVPQNYIVPSKRVIGAAPVAPFTRIDEEAMRRADLARVLAVMPLEGFVTMSNLQAALDISIYRIEWVARVHGRKGLFIEGDLGRAKAVSLASEAARTLALEHVDATRLPNEDLNKVFGEARGDVLEVLKIRGPSTKEEIGHVLRGRGTASGKHVARLVTVLKEEELLHAVRERATRPQYAIIDRGLGFGS